MHCVCGKEVEYSGRCCRPSGGHGISILMMVMHHGDAMVPKGKYSTLSFECEE